jgi:ABC-type lipopolysaccharide export system ATPase subunit
VIISGHEVHTLLDVADHITWCTSGTTYEIGTSEQARAHEALRREYLGPRNTP